MRGKPERQTLTLMLSRETGKNSLHGLDGQGDDGGQPRHDVVAAALRFGVGDADVEFGTGLPEAVPGTASPAMSAACCVIVKKLLQQIAAGWSVPNAGDGHGGTSIRNRPPAAGS